MVTIINLLGALITLSIMALLVIWFIYFILLLRNKKINKDIISSRFRKILWVITYLPFMFSGAYILSLISAVKITINAKILLIFLGLILIIYPLLKLSRKIKDIDYFGDV